MSLIMRSIKYTPYHPSMHPFDHVLTHNMMMMDMQGKQSLKSQPNISGKNPYYLEKKTTHLERI